MPFYIVRNDITKMECDAVVNAANNSLLGGGGVDGVIHRAAGPELLEECRKLGGCETGQAKITSAYRLPCRYVIHTVGPVWRGGGHGERAQLASCYKNSLLLAEANGCETVAFPLISAGAYGYPRREAMNVAVETVESFLQGSDMTVYLVVFDRSSYEAGGELFPEIKAYIDDVYAEAHADKMRRQTMLGESMPMSVNYAAAPSAARKAADPGLAAAVKRLDESFSEMLLRKIDERGIKDSVCYKRANVDRKLFSKIRSNKNYHPKKETAIAFAVALELDIDETRELLMKAGFALSHSSKADIIVEYFIRHGEYDVMKINEALFAFDQSLLGGQ